MKKQIFLFIAFVILNCLFLSSNCPAQWIQTNGPYGGDINCLAVSGSNIYAGTYDSGVFLSTNNGTSWTNTGLTKGIYSLAVNGTFIFAGTNRSGIYKRPLSNFVVSNCSAQFNIVPDTLIQHHYYITNNATGVLPLTYLWSWGDGTYDTIAFPSHTYSVAGNYCICLTITDFTGCTNTICTSSFIQKSTNSIITVDVIPPGTVGLHEYESSHQFMVFPNPASTKITIEIHPPNTLQNSFVSVFSITGQLLMQKAIVKPQTDIDISELAKGFYFLKMESNDKTDVMKFVKE